MRSRVKVTTLGSIRKIILAHGSTIKCKELAALVGPTVTSISASSPTTSDMVRVNSPGAMVESMKVAGSKVSKAATDTTPTRMG